MAIAAARATTTGRAATGVARPEPPEELVDPRTVLTNVRTALADLSSREGTYQGAAIGEAARHAHRTSVELGRLVHESQNGAWGRERRQASRQLPGAARAAEVAEHLLQDLVGAATASTT